MADSADYAADLVDLDISNRLAAHRAKQVPATQLACDCSECGDAIPAERLAIVNTEFCAECAGILERVA